VRLEEAGEHGRHFLGDVWGPGDGGDLGHVPGIGHGDAAEVMIASGKTNFVKGKHELLPIPAIQIELSGGSLTQNNGY